MKGRYNHMYLVCHEHTKEMKDFLNTFLNETKNDYNYEDWITFSIPKSDFTVSLMKGNDQDLTQNITFEISFDSKKELEEFSKEHKCKIESFVSDKTRQKYKYYYSEIIGPAGICKVEANFTEDINN